MTTTSAQQEFNDKYITSTEIGRMFGVSRSTVMHARKRGMLPDGIVVEGKCSYIWKREDLKPYLDAWSLSLQSRRKQLV